MTNKNDPVRVFLGSYWEMRQEARRLEKRVEELTCQAEKVTASYAYRAGSSSPKGNHASVWDALVLARERVGENLKAALTREAEIEDFIDRLGCPEQRQLLRLRYLELLPWEQIAALMKYTDRHTRRLHGQALQEARRVWTESYGGEKHGT